MWNELRVLWSEPRPVPPPGTPWWDRALSLALVPATLAEAVLREDHASRPVRFAIGVALAATLWFRRAHPLGAVAAAFGLSTAIVVAETLIGVSEVGPHTGMCILLLPYSLFRWGSWREVALGLAFVASAYASAAIHGEMAGLGDAVGAAVVLLFPGALGASVRFRAAAHRREIEHAKLREREELARELHDVVAHRVTAITVQAQAGRAVIAARPDAAAGALKAIEEEAARTLAELRAMVGALRDDRAPALAPAGGLADIERLAGGGGDGPAVEVEIVGDAAGLRPAMETTLFRLTRESITNVVRHARNATRIRVCVVLDDVEARLTVHDDGETPLARQSAGYGLVGMAERAALLGGTLEAGPSAGGGWRVEVVLPRRGGAP